MSALVSPESEDTGLPKNREAAPEKTEWNEKPVFRVEDGVSVGMLAQYIVSSHRRIVSAEVSWRRVVDSVHEIWRLLHAGACWAWVAVMPPAYGLGNAVERRGSLAVRLAMEPLEMELFVMALRAGPARSLGGGGRNRASSAQEGDAAKDEQ